MNKTGKRICSVALAMLMTVTLLAGVPAKEVQAATTLQNPRRDNSGVVTWDCVYFGRYPQSDATGKTKDPIKWRVLSVEGEDAFLVADTNLDLQRYNWIWETATWETCTMRSWLNGYGSNSNVGGEDYSGDNFIDRAFTAVEQDAIITTTVVNADNPLYGTAGGNNTKDKVFLLSYDEVTNPAYGFSSDYSTDDNARKRRNTAYVAGGGTIGSSNMSSKGSTDWWWLRSPGYDSSNAMLVSYDGDVYQNGDDVLSPDNAACPALHLNLSSSNLWSYAGTVSSDGSSTEGENPPDISDENKDVPKAGTQVTVGNGIYKVTTSTSSRKEVTYVKPKSSKKTSVTIPSTVKINGYTCKVTGIASNAFVNNKKLTKVTIGKNVTSIGKSAFKKCTKLKNVIIKSPSLKTIGSNAFNGDKNLKNIIIKSKKLTSKSIGKNVFKGTNKKLVIKVPKSKVKSYKKFLTKKGNAKVHVRKG